MSVPEDPKSAIDQVIEEFDADPETEQTEAALTELLATYPDNQDLRHILVKVVAINTLYHVRVLDIDLHALALHIKGIAGLDEKLRNGSADAVDAIWKFKGTRGHYPSFATKYCSWHNQDAYPISDTYVWEALTAYRSLRQGFTFRDKECNDHEGYRTVVKRFQKHFGLDHYSMKQIDKFLWVVGARIIEEKKRKKEVLAAR
jgi:hypothetical protein